MFATIFWILLKAILVLACVFLIVMVLLQQARGGGLVGALGGLGSESALGAKAGTTAQKITIGLAVVFLTMTIVIGKWAPRVRTSVVEETTSSGAHSHPEPEQPADKGGDNAKNSAAQEKPGKSGGKADTQTESKKPSPPAGRGEKNKTE